MAIALLASGAIPGFVSEEGLTLGLFPTWGLGSMAVLGPLFLWFWLVTAIAGFFSPPETRPYTGFLMLGASTFIFALGPGTQDFGSALLGQWFPTVYQGIAGATEPVNDILSSFGAGFSNAFLLITNPTAYAQGIINGSYERDPVTGLAGAFGVEIEELRNTPIFPGQPYTLTIKVENKGSSPAENVILGIKPGEKRPKKENVIEVTVPFIDPIPGERMQDIKIRYKLLSFTEITMPSLGFWSQQLDDDKPGLEMICNDDKCEQNIDFMATNELVEMDIRQAFFTSLGLTCPVIQGFNLREQFIPFVGTVEYDYAADSSMSIEFISQNEWDRRVREGFLITQAKKPASLKNAPVRLNFDTLEQPIRGGTPLFLGINLVSSKRKGTIKEIFNISVDFPDGLSIQGCTPEAFNQRDSSRGEDPYVWKGTGGKPLTTNLIYCNIRPVSFDGPEKTFVVRATASYRFLEEKSFIPSKLEFGGLRCCTKDADCEIEGQICGSTNVCQSALPDLGDSCTTTDGCADREYPYLPGATVPSPLSCRATSLGNVCCQADAEIEQCALARELRLDQKVTGEIIEAQQAIHTSASP